MFNGLIQVLMWVSRLYISAHFPHQCLMGFVVGLITVRCDIFILSSSKLVNRETLLRIFYRRAAWVQLSSLSLVLASLSLVISSLALFTALESLGRDPTWSLALAQKHCQVS